MLHVRYIQLLEPLGSSVDDVDGIGPQAHIEQKHRKAVDYGARNRHLLDQGLELGFGYFRDGLRRAALGHRGCHLDTRCIKIDIRQCDLKVFRYQQRVIRIRAELMVQKMREAQMRGSREDRLAKQIQNPRLRGAERSQRDFLGSRLLRRQQQRAARERETQGEY